VTPDEIAEHLAHLRDAGEQLKKRPFGEVLDLLGAVLDGWRDPNSGWRRDLEERLPSATGFTAPLVREGLRRALDDWTSDALRELATRELGPIDAIDSASGRRVSGFDTTAVLLAGSIPMPSLLALIAPLAMRSPVIAKPASRDPLTPHLVARSIAETDAELGRCIWIASFDAANEDCTRALLEADCICATGSDATIAAVQSQARPPRRLVVDGHRLSIAAVAPPENADRRIDLAKRLAVDIALWDQLGCLSPIAVFAVDPEPSRAAALGELAARIDRRECCPRDRATARRGRASPRGRARDRGPRQRLDGLDGDRRRWARSETRPAASLHSSRSSGGPREPFGCDSTARSSPRGGGHRGLWSGGGRARQRPRRTRRFARLFAGFAPEPPAGLAPREPGRPGSASPIRRHRGDPLEVGRVLGG